MSVSVCCPRQELHEVPSCPGLPGHCPCRGTRLVPGNSNLLLAATRINLKARAASWNRLTTGKTTCCRVCTKGEKEQNT